MAASERAPDFAQRSLRFGDIILLKQDGKSGFVSAQERMCPQVRLEELIDGTDFPPDVAECQFQVMQKCQYTQKAVFLRELAKNGLPDNYLAELDNKESEDFNGKLFPDVKSARAQYRLTQMYTAFKREKLVNDQEFALVVGDDVMYGQVMQLRHVGSGKIVTIKKQASDVERGALKVVLEDGGADGSWFQLFSGYRTKPEGSRVMPSEVIVLRSLTFNGNGLHLSVVEVTEETMLPVSPHIFVRGTLEISASPELCALKIVPFSVHSKELPVIEEQLCGHACVQIQRAASEPTLPWNCKLRIRHIPTGNYLAAISTQAKAAVVQQQVLKKAGARPSTSSGPEGPGPVQASATAVQASSAAAQASSAAVPATPAPPATATSLPAALTDTDIITSADMQLKLTSRYTHPDTIWTLVMFNAEAEPCIHHKAYAFFRHEGTSFWMSGAGPCIPQPCACATMSARHHLLLCPHTPAAHDTSSVAADPSGPEGEGYGPAVHRTEQHYPVLHPKQLERNVMLITKVDELYAAKVLALRQRLATLNFFDARFTALALPSERALIAAARAPHGVQAVLKTLSEPALLALLRSWGGHANRALRNLAFMMDDASWDAKGRSRGWGHLQGEGWTLATVLDTFAGRVKHQLLLVVATVQVLVKQMGILSATLALLSHLRVRVMAMSPTLERSAAGHVILDIGRNCHKVLKAACFANEQNQSVVGSAVTMVMSHLACSILAADTMAAIYADNMTQMATVTQASDIICASVQMIRNRGFAPRYVNFLRKICGTFERPMPNNQNWLATEILCGEHEAKTVLFNAEAAQMLDVNGEMKDTWKLTVAATAKHGCIVIDCSTFTSFPEDATTRSISDWKLSSNDGKGYGLQERELFLYYCHSLQFITALCMGRNGLVRQRLLAQSWLGLEFEQLHSAVQHPRLPFIYSRNELTGQAKCPGPDTQPGWTHRKVTFPFRTVPPQVQNPRLPYVLRTIMLQVILALYVDIEPFRTVMLPHNIRMLPSRSVASQLDADASSDSLVSDAGATLGHRRNPTPAHILALIGSMARHLGAALELSLADAAGLDTLKSVAAARAAAAGGAPGAGQDDSEVDVELHKGATTVGRNSFVLQLLRLLRELFRLGMLELGSDTTRAILELLVTLLQQMDSLPLNDEDRFKSCLVSSVVMEAKKVILQVLEFALDMQTEQQCAAVFATFAAWKRSPQHRKAWAQKHGSDIGNKSLHVLRAEDSAEDDLEAYFQPLNAATGARSLLPLLPLLQRLTSILALFNMTAACACP
ncbi:MAG: hypothetical protein WDW38_002895 [Sanguina aurantia]